MDTFLFIVGILFLLGGSFGLINHGLYLRCPMIYSKDEIKDLKSITYDSIMGLIGIFLIGPSLWAGGWFICAYLITFLLSFKVKV